MRTAPLMLLLAALPALAQAPVVWERDLAVALNRARAEKKVVFLDLWAEWCPPCRHLKENVFPKPAAAAALAKVVPLAVLVEKKDRTPIPEGVALARRFGLRAYPTLILLDADGKELRRYEGAFRTPEEFAAWLSAR